MIHQLRSRRRKVPKILVWVAMKESVLALLNACVLINGAWHRIQRNKGRCQMCPELICCNEPMVSIFYSEMMITEMKPPACIETAYAICLKYFTDDLKGARWFYQSHPFARSN